MVRAWDVQYTWNPWLSVGFHLDHTDPSLTLHLPVIIIALGRLKQPGFRHSLFRDNREEVCMACLDNGGDDGPSTG